MAAVVLPVPETASKKVMEKAPNSVAEQIKYTEGMAARAKAVSSV